MTESSPVSPAGPSVTAPIDEAFSWTGRVLFKPFDIGKWFTLGFCAWLAILGEGGSNWSNGLNRLGDSFDDSVGNGTVDWARDNLALIVGIGTIVMIIGLAFGVLLLWLSSRGKFMFLDGVVHNRGLVAEPWNRFRESAWSLFLFRVTVSLVGFVLVVLVLGAAFGSAWSMGLDDDGLSGLGWLVLLVWGVLFLAIALAFGLINLATNDFIVPIMWLRGSRVGEAWAELQVLSAGRGGTFFAYVLIKIAIALVTGMIACALVFVTCCLAAIPYVGTVLLLPLYVFNRSYSIHFLSRFGPDYAALAPLHAAPAGEPPAAPTPPPAPGDVPPVEP